MFNPLNNEKWSNKTEREKHIQNKTFLTTELKIKKTNANQNNRTRG